MSSENQTLVRHTLKDEVSNLSYPITRRSWILQQYEEKQPSRALARAAKKSIKASVGADMSGGTYWDLITKFNIGGLNGGRPLFREKVSDKDLFELSEGQQHKGTQPILASPEVILSIDNNEVAAQYTLNVCSETNLAKLFSRYTLLSSNGKPATYMGRDSVIDFYQLTDKFSNQFLSEWKELYLQDMATAGLSTDVVPYPFDVSAVNYDHQGWEETITIDLPPDVKNPSNVLTQRDIDLIYSM